MNVTVLVTVRFTAVHMRMCEFVTVLIYMRMLMKMFVFMSVSMLVIT